MATTPSDPQNRPIFLDLRRIRFPVGAVASILHRITGVLLVVAVPAGLGLAEYSTRSASHFRWVADLLNTPWAALVGAGGLAGLVHHLLAGVRVLLMDVGVGVGLPAARRSAWGSLAAAAAAGVLGLVALWPAEGGVDGL
jgi:succinate dehydrogenase / fumarate reductase cytochrome b subunit